MDTVLASCTDAAALAAAIAHRCPQVCWHGDQWQACCPAHDDQTPSLSITPTADKVRNRSGNEDIALAIMTVSDVSSRRGTTQGRFFNMRRFAANCLVSWYLELCIYDQKRIGQGRKSHSPLPHGAVSWSHGAVTRLQADATPIQREARRSARQRAALNVIGLVKPMHLSHRAGTDIALRHAYQDALHLR